MPIVHVEIFEGRAPEVKLRLCRAITDAVEQNLGVPRGDVRVIIDELKRENFTVGGEPKPRRSGE
jgi:4-oxalocrotonate tautomerase